MCPGRRSKLFLCKWGQVTSSAKCDGGRVTRRLSPRRTVCDIADTMLLLGRFLPSSSSSSSSDPDIPGIPQEGPGRARFLLYPYRRVNDDWEQALGLTALASPVSSYFSLLVFYFSSFFLYRFPSFLLVLLFILYFKRPSFLQLYLSPAHCVAPW